jgi:hypothetical protein
MAEKRIFVSMAERRRYEHFRKPVEPLDARCLGCQYAMVLDTSLYCYMFKDKPETLPCGRHYVEGE